MDYTILYKKRPSRPYSHYSKGALLYFLSVAFRQLLPEIGIQAVSPAGIRLFILIRRDRAWTSNRDSAPAD
jgi:hypothetical protein